MAAATEECGEAYVEGKETHRGKAQSSQQRISRITLAHAVCQRPLVNIALGQNDDEMAFRLIVLFLLCTPFAIHPHRNIKSLIMALEDEDAASMGEISIELARPRSDHPNITNILKAAYALQSGITATMKTSGSDDTMVSVPTTKENRFVEALDELREEVNEVLEEKVKELTRRFGEDQVSASLHSSAHSRL